MLNPFGRLILFFIINFFCPQKKIIKNKSHFKKTPFHLEHEKIIFQLAVDIQNNKYRPGMSRVFIVLKPKPREVIAGMARDRIVHHFLYDYRGPYWEKRFSPYFYACRVGKGPLNAVKDLFTWIRQEMRRSSAPLYYLKLDMRNFFPSMDHRIFDQIISKHLTNQNYLQIGRTLIYHRPTKQGSYKACSPTAYWQK